MSRKMSPEREQEYAELHAYLDFCSTNIWGIDPADPVHPTNVGKRIVKAYGKSKALDGLKQAVNDTVEALSGHPFEYIRRLDAALRAQGIVTFSEIRRRYSSSYKRILKRGRIKNETEYYLIAGILADLDSDASESERGKLEQIVAQYEQGA